ncbi:MAG: phosphatidate cytidylyltransferase [Kofleriaceae bacterium]|nr:phosphatidate cytidylyltransferase [Kofleriaceae bacterium]
MALGNLASRFLVAVVALPPLLYAIYLDSSHYVWGIVFVASLIAMYEYLAMGIEDETDRRASLAIGAASVALLYWLPPSAQPALVSVVVAVLGTSLYYLFRFGEIESVADRLNTSVLAIVFGGIMFSFVSLLKREGGAVGGDIIVLILLTAWASDTGGYFAGKYLGKAKLYPAVSPKKTWAGSIGGVAAVLVAVSVFKHFQMPGMPWVDLYLMCGVGAVLGQLGDLCESLVKRSRGVKDSGSILPGHGGILDRVDAVLFIAPYFFVYMSIRTTYF